MAFLTVKPMSRGRVVRFVWNTNTRTSPAMNLGDGGPPCDEAERSWYRVATGSGITLSSSVSGEFERTRKPSRAPVPHAISGANVGDVTDESARRVALAERIGEHRRRALGHHVLAVACYGSVAHGRTDAASDLEMIVLTDDGVPAIDEHFIEDGVQVECDLLPFERLLAAAVRVADDWGAEADCYRSTRAVWDPDARFAAVRAAHLATPNAHFAVALERSWWAARELREKVRSQAGAGDGPGVRFAAWQYAYRAAMRIALHDRAPYESSRTLWAEAAARGYGMPGALAALVRGEPRDLEAAVARLHNKVGAWGAPERPGVPYGIPK